MVQTEQTMLPLNMRSLKRDKEWCGQELKGQLCGCIDQDKEGNTLKKTELLIYSCTGPYDKMSVIILMSEFCSCNGYEDIRISVSN